MLYVAKTLLSTAVTGPAYDGRDGRRWSHRRQPLGVEPPADAANLPEGLYPVDRLLEYLPPWQAYHHRKCGFYQDYYLVRWGPPFSDVDYRETECGSEDVKGATWEADECLP